MDLPARTHQGLTPQQLIVVAALTAGVVTLISKWLLDRDQRAREAARAEEQRQRQNQLASLVLAQIAAEYQARQRRDEEARAAEARRVREHREAEARRDREHREAEQRRVREHREAEQRRIRDAQSAETKRFGSARAAEQRRQQGFALHEAGRANTISEWLAQAQREQRRALDELAERLEETKSHGLWLAGLADEAAPPRATNFFDTESAYADLDRFSSHAH